MANLYARIAYDHHAGYITRLGHKWISTTTETWTGKIKVDLDKDGNCHIRITDKHNNPIVTILDGNLDEIVKDRTQFKLIPLAELATGFVPNYE